MNTFGDKAKEETRATWQKQAKCKQAKLGTVKLKQGSVQATKKLVFQVAFAKSQSEGKNIFGELIAGCFE